MARRTRCRTWLVLPLLVGCSSWSAHGPGVAPTEGRLQVWHDGEATELRRPTVTADSLVGQDPRGYSLRFARQDVDSVRVRRFDLGKTFLVVFGIVPASIITILALDPPDSL